MNPPASTESDLYFGEVVPSLMREIARDHQFEPRFDALVVDEAQDQDTSWRESESDEAACRLVGSLLAASSRKDKRAHGYFLRLGPKAALSAKGGIRRHAYFQTSVATSARKPVVHSSLLATGFRIP